MHDNQEARLQSLEVTNRWLKGGLIVACCLAFVALFRAAPAVDPAATSEIVRTRKLEIVNDAGETVATAMSIGESGGLISVGGKAGAVGLSGSGDSLIVFANRIKSKQTDSHFVLSCAKGSTSLKLQHGDQGESLVVENGSNGVRLPRD
jgi:hypothetical protein